MHPQKKKSYPYSRSKSSSSQPPPSLTCSKSRPRAQHALPRFHPPSCYLASLTKKLMLCPLSVAFGDLVRMGRTFEFEDPGDDALGG